MKDPKWQKERFFFLDPKTDEMEFITTQEATKFLGRKQPLKKRPSVLRAEVIFLISSLLSFMKFIVLV